MSGTPEDTRDPYLEWIASDAGLALGVGVTGGGLYHFIRGSTRLNSPMGLRERFIAGTRAARMNTPRSACCFTAGIVLFDSLRHYAATVRQKEDPWNLFVAGVGTGGVFGMRYGPRVAAPLALVCGFAGALFDVSYIKLKQSADSYDHPN